MTLKDQSLGIRSRLAYFARRIRGLNGSSLLKRARSVAAAFDRPVAVVLTDMLWSAAFRDTGFQDYVDWDFAILSRPERATFMTNAISNHIAEKYNERPFRRMFENKTVFNEKFDNLLERSWLDVEAASADEVRDFVVRAGRVMGKVPVSNSGYGVEKYAAADIEDWSAFRDKLLEKGQTLLEEYIKDQHPALAAVCPGVVNTTRVTTFLRDGEVHVMSFAQKFGVGDGASDQQAFGGFFTLLDENGRSLGPGYGSHQNIYREHPETGASIVDFHLPMASEIIALATAASKVVPEIRYVGWDIVLRKTGPVILEGNWMPGAYENKPSATNVRTGSLPRFRALMGF